MENEEDKDYEATAVANIFVSLLLPPIGLLVAMGIMNNSRNPKAIMMSKIAIGICAIYAIIIAIIWWNNSHPAKDDIYGYTVVENGVSASCTRDSITLEPIGPPQCNLGHRSTPTPSSKTSSSNSSYSMYDSTNGIASCYKDSLGTLNASNCGIGDYKVKDKVMSPSQCETSNYFTEGMYTYCISNTP